MTARLSDPGSGGPWAAAGAGAEAEAEPAAVQTVTGSGVTQRPTEQPTDPGGKVTGVTAPDHRAATSQELI